MERSSESSGVMNCKDLLSTWANITIDEGLCSIELAGHDLRGPANSGYTGKDLKTFHPLAHDWLTPLKVSTKFV
jgi:hypothetical protein